MHFCVGLGLRASRYRRAPCRAEPSSRSSVIACIAGRRLRRRRHGRRRGVRRRRRPSPRRSRRSRRPRARSSCAGRRRPARTAPYELSGTYTARFEQYAPEDPNLDFAAQTPFVARLDPHADSDAGAKKAVPLFETAAHTGTATVRANGRLWIDVEFGDFPYVIRLTPKR